MRPKFTYLVQCLIRQVGVISLERKELQLRKTHMLKVLQIIIIRNLGKHERAVRKVETSPHCLLRM